jgi:hypothetical protein
MTRMNSIISASLMVAIAAGAAGVFTVATDASSKERVQLHGSAVRHDAPTELRTLFFDAQPIAGSNPAKKEITAPKIPGIAGEQFVPERATDTRQRGRLANGCESGLSPDLSPTVAEAGRCIT